MNLTKTIEKEYEQIEEKSIEELNCKNDETEQLEILMDLYKYWLEHTRTMKFDFTFYNEAYNLFFDALHTNIDNLTLKDITLFSLKLEEYESRCFFEYTGYFISAMINYHHFQTKSKDTYIIFTEGFSTKLQGIAKDNNANVHIIGDVGERAANNMNGGRIHIEGNTLGYCCERLQNGTVFISGNVTDNFCSKMTDGNVHLKGNAEDFACEFMQGGTVIIEKNVANKACQGMYEGNVTIKGNAGREFAAGMSNGIIYLGEEYQSLGDNIKGGTIKGIEK